MPTCSWAIIFICADGPPPLATFSYDGNGNRTTNTLENGTSVEYFYNDGSGMTSLMHKTNGTSFASFAYAYNSVGNRTSRVETNNATAITDTYGYDATHQVSSVNYNASQRVVSHQWDAVGNRVSVTNNGTSTSYTANSLNQYTAVGGDSPTYDNRGNLITQNGWTYTFDGQNRLLTATNNTTTSSFAYDARNRCVSRTIDGVTTLLIYDNWNLIEEWTTGGAQISHYVHGPRIDEILVKVSTTNAVYYHHDALGNVTHLTGTNGAVVERYTYDVFGAVMIKDGSGNTLSGTAYANRFLFTGREWLTELGIYDYRNRVYSAELGRFLQPDPIQFAAGDVNIYRYCRNKSVTSVDSFGLWEGDVHDQQIHEAFDRYNGLPPDLIADLMDYSRRWDSASQAIHWSYAHSMRMPFQDPQDAIRQRDQFIQDMTQAAQGAMDENMRRVFLAMALHAVMDSTSPVHVNPQTGVPYSWWLLNFAPHVFGGEGQNQYDDLDPIARQNMLDQMRRLLEQVYPTD